MGVLREQTKMLDSIKENLPFVFDRIYYGDKVKIENEKYVMFGEIDSQGAIQITVGFK
jgi:hypothetical protein